MNPGIALVAVGCVLILRGGAWSTVIGAVLAFIGIFGFGDVPR